MFYVVDQNMMRRPELAELVQDPSGPDFVLPDTSFVEMCKSHSWEETMRGSLKHLSSVPGRVHGTVSYGHAIRREIETRRPTRGEDLLDADHTLLVRRIMAVLALGRESLDDLRAEVAAIRPAVVDEQMDATGEKDAVGGMIEAFASDAGVELVDAVRRSGRDDDVVLAMVQHVAEATLFGTLVDVHVMRVEEMAGFVAAKPLLLRHHILRVRQVLRWIVDHGFEGADPGRILNDSFDHEYVAIGSYFDGVLTRDGRAKGADRDLRTLLDDDASRSLRQVYRESLGRVGANPGD